jgi:hypothetical protein
MGIGHNWPVAVAIDEHHIARCGVKALGQSPRVAHKTVGKTGEGRLRVRIIHHKHALRTAISSLRAGEALRWSPPWARCMKGI